MSLNEASQSKPLRKLHRILRREQKAHVRDRLRLAQGLTCGLAVSSFAFTGTGCGTPLRNMASTAALISCSVVVFGVGVCELVMVETRVN